MVKDKDKKIVEEEINEKELCEKCGSVLVEEEGKSICPSCDAEIDFFGEKEDK